MIPDWDYEYEDAKCLVCNKLGKAYSAEYVCDSCRADAALGRAVRRLGRDAYDLFHCERLWGVSHRERGTVGSGKTPEAALKAAGLMEVEK